MPGTITYQTKEYSDEELLPLLSPLVKEWFTTKFPSFGPPQRMAIMDIHSRKNVLVCAPTGSGKTLTAFLSVLNELVDSAQKGILENKIYCVYISPLKALNNDIARNLIEPLQEITALAGKDLGIRVAVRTGDTTTAERTKMLKSPPHILITTPESLGILLSSEKFSTHLKQVDWCIIDEIHSLAENKRGVHLSLSLERLQRLCSHTCRVGLSATVAPLDDVARFLGGTNRDVSIVEVQYLKKYDLGVLSPVKNLIDTPHFVMHNSLYEKLHELIQAHKTTLIFTNTRAGTERVVDNLKSRYPKDYVANIGAHHGSMGKEMRLDIEKRLRNGELKACVSSTSLELGIDIGYIDLVICIGSPKSVARFLQRCGRAGHKLHETVKGRLIVMDRDDLVECAILLKNANEKKIDRIHIPKNCLDVLAQHIVGMVLEQEWSETELYDCVKQSYCYRELKWEHFSEILDYLAGKFVDLQQRYIFAKLWREGGRVGRRGRMSRVIYMTNIGTIPEETFITVKVGDQVIGKLDEGFLEKMKSGDIFVLGGETYSFKFSRGMVAQVSATPVRPPTVPSWVSETLPLSYDLARAIGTFRRLVADRFAAGDPKADILTFIQTYAYLDESAALAVYDYLKEQYQYIKLIPNDKLIVIEDVQDPENQRLIFHTLFGRRVNDCLSRAIAFIISRKFHRDVEMGINDNGFFIAGVQKVQISEILKLLRSEKLDILMGAAIEHTEIYKRRFRHCAERALMILKNYMGRKKTVGKQQVSSTILMSALKRINQRFSILEEAKREVLEDLMDIENTKKVLAEIEANTIQVRQVSVQLPSPFAFNIALQGHLDVLKIEDKHEFLRRMHEYVLAKIGQTNTDVNMPKLPEAAGAEKDPYEELWRKEDEERQLRAIDEKALLKADAEIAVRKLKLPTDYFRNICQLIDGEKTGYRSDFIEWLDRSLSGEIPRAISDRLAKFLLQNKLTIS